MVQVVGKFDVKGAELLVTMKATDSLSQMKHAIIFAYLKYYQNNISKVASKLKISRQTIYNIKDIYTKESL